MLSLALVLGCPYRKNSFIDPILGLKGLYLGPSVGLEARIVLNITGIMRALALALVLGFGCPCPPLALTFESLLASQAACALCCFASPFHFQ